MQDNGDPALECVTQTELEHYYMDQLVNDWFISDCQLDFLKQREFEIYLRECAEEYADGLD